MHPWIAVVVVLLLQTCLTSATPDRTNDYRSQSPGLRTRRHETEERPSSGRRWTTSRNSPYQKIVSSYEQEAPEGGRDEADQAKAKSSKRKPLRTSALSHDQIASETSAVSGNEKVDSEINAAGTEDAEGDKKSTAVISRRRSSVGIPRDISSEKVVETSTVNPKKRRRIVTTTSTTTLAPQTMSDSLYQYFRPLERDVPQDDIIPFLDFGRKLSPVIPTPSGANSIDSKTVVTKLRPRNQYEDKESHSSDEDLLQEDMDVTVVKKAIERNSVPRGKLRVREQGISDYYRKRGPVQIRTTENLISTSDSSTASPLPNVKHIGVIKKINRHQLYHTQPYKSFEEQVSDQFSSAESSHSVKNIEVLQDKRRQYLRPVQRLAAIKQENSHSPLTAESTLVKTIIKELPKEEVVVKNNESIVENKQIRTNNSYSNSINAALNNPSKSPKLTEEPILTSEQKINSKILSTAVVTSVSVQESLENPQMHSVTEHPNKIANSNDTPDSPLPLSAVVYDTTNNLTSVEAKSVPQKNTTDNKPSTPIVSATIIAFETKTTTVKTETPLRSRDIYKPKTIPPGSYIPHLPRIIPNPSHYLNKTNRTTSPLLTIYTTEKINQSSIPTNTTTPHTSTTSSISTTSTTSSTTTSDTSSTTPITITPASSSTTAIPISPSHTTEIPTKFQEASTTTSKTPIMPERQPEKHNEELSPTKEILNNENLDKHLSIVQATVQEMTTPTEISSTTSETIPIVYEEISSKKDTPADTPNETDTPLLHVYNGHEDNISHSVESESVPPPKNEAPTEPILIVPVFSPDEKIVPEDQYQVYFTIPPTSTIPVVDTRPDAEAEVVEEKNVTSFIPSSTHRPAVEWVKLGAVEKEVEVVYPEPMGLAAYMLAALGVVPVLIGALIGARFLMAHNKKKVLDESEYSSEYNRSPLGISNTPLPTKLPRIPTHVSWNETEKSPLASGPAPGTIPSGRWEFPREKLRLQTLLGQGNFGQVWKAEADDIAGHEGLTRLVAVKTVKECANAREREDLLRELGIMQELGSHPNVVTLLGCCTEKEPIYVVMEYVMFGKLLSFLRDHRTRAHYYNFSDATDALTSRDLTVFAYCVARGMDYLTNKSIIHRDIAARNVLVDHNKLCKIADFGMSRNVRDTGQIYEQRQSKGALPIRWMAPESLHFSLFTHKTDVWSFGILMWEIVTLGSTPYATMGAREVMRRVRDGYRLERPTHCHPQLFRVIDRCWHSEPSKRPSFAELKAELAQLLSDSEHKGSFVDLDSYADQMRRDSLHRHV